jgi:hypothetical protein
MNGEPKIPTVLLGRDDELSCHRDYSLHVRDFFTKVIATLKWMPQFTTRAVSARLRVIAPGLRLAGLTLTIGGSYSHRSKVAMLGRIVDARLTSARRDEK